MKKTHSGAWILMSMSKGKLFLEKDKSGAVVRWLLLLHSFIQQNLHSGSEQFQISTFWHVEGLL